MRSKLLWFYQEVDEPETVTVPDIQKPGPSRAAASNTSKTPQGKKENAKNLCSHQLIQLTDKIIENR